MAARRHPFLFPRRGLAMGCPLACPSVQPKYLLFLNGFKVFFAFSAPLMIPLLIYSVQISQKISVANKDDLNPKIDEKLREYLQHQVNGTAIIAGSLDENLLTQKIKKGIENFVLRQRLAQ